jgi:hypothetical protein
MANKSRLICLGVLLLSVLAIGCRLSGQPDKNTIRCFRIEIQSPWYDSKGKLDSSMTMSYWYYTCGEWRVYENVDYSPGDYHPGSDGFPFRKKHRYFVFQKDSIYGYQYEAGNADHAKRLRIDSIKKAWPGGQGGKGGRQLPSLEEAIANGLLRHAYTQKKDGSGRWTEAYTDSSTRKDTFFLYFSPHFKALPPDLHLSLSTGLDSLRHAKLVKMIVQRGPHFEKRENATIGPTAMTIELSEPEVFDRDIVFSYFVRYWRDCPPAPSR